VRVDGVVVAGVPTIDGGLSFRHVEVTVHNTSDHPVTPMFMVSSGGPHPSGFWHSTVVRGDDPVGPGGDTEFALRPTRYTPTPSHGQWWLVAVYTTSPDALSTSPLQPWRLGVVGH
jgi:hypothetical protein